MFTKQTNELGLTLKSFPIFTLTLNGVVHIWLNILCTVLFIFFLRKFPLLTTMVLVIGISLRKLKKGILFE